MSVTNTIRAWKDEEYLAGLSEANRVQLPPNPAGSIARDLGHAGGAMELFTIYKICHPSIVIECSASNCA